MSCVLYILCSLVWFDLMVFNATFNNISAISAASFIGGETGGPGENHRHVASH